MHHDRCKCQQETACLKGTARGVHARCLLYDDYDDSSGNNSY